MRTNLILVLFFLLQFFGCSANKPDGQLVFWHSFVAATHPALNDLISAFEKENPAISIRAQYVPTGDALIQKLVTAIKSNTAPDIAWIHADFLDKLISSQSIYPMNYFLDKDRAYADTVLPDIYQQLLQPVRFGDTLFAMPMEATSLALIYNKDMFRAVGLDPDQPPQNWTELQQYCRLLTRDIDSDGRTDEYGFYVPVFPASGALNIWMMLQWTPFLWQAGGDIMNDTHTDVIYNSAAGAAALGLWKDLYDQMGFQNFTVAHDMGFVSGKLAMILDGPWNLPRYREINQFEWAVAPLPAGPVRQTTYMAGEHLVIFKQSRMAEEAWDLIRYVLRPEVQAKFSMASGYLPVRKTSLLIPEYKAYLEQDQAMRVFNRQLANARGREPAGRFSIEINQHIAQAIENAIVGHLDPATALNRSAELSRDLMTGHDTIRP